MHYSLSIEDEANKLLEFYGNFLEQIGFMNYFKDWWEQQLNEFKYITMIIIVGIWPMLFLNPS